MLFASSKKIELPFQKDLITMLWNCMMNKKAFWALSITSKLWCTYSSISEKRRNFKKKKTLKYFALLDQKKKVFFCCHWITSPKKRPWINFEGWHALCSLKLQRNDFKISIISENDGKLQLYTSTVPIRIY